MNKEPETYEELIRKKRCVDLTQHYNLTKDDLDLIYNFLEKNPDGMILGSTNVLSFMVKNQIVYSIVSRCINSSIDGLTLSKNYLRLKPHYTPSSGGHSSGGSSSNNNNNNNNNNNKNERSNNR